MDRYQAIREMPFTVIAQALGIDTARFRPRKGGTEFGGPCPVHRPKRNGTSFSYSADGKLACFSCGAKGRGSIDLAMAVRGVGFQEAVAILEPFAGAALAAAAPRVVTAIKLTLETPAEKRPLKASYGEFFRPHPWLETRGMSQAALDRFGSGYYENPSRKSAYSGSVLLRIRRFNEGEVVGHLSRNIGEATSERPKYRFAEGFQKSLEVFGSFELSEEHRLPLRVVYLAESPFTVLRFWQMGVPCVSTFGWAVSDRQADIVSRLAKGVVALPDRDKFPQFDPGPLARRMWVKVPELPPGVDDPERLSRERVSALT